MKGKFLLGFGLLALLTGACSSLGSASNVLEVCGSTDTPACESEEQLQVTFSRDACFEVFSREPDSETREYFTSVIPIGNDAVEHGKEDYQGILWEVVEDNMVRLTLDREGKEFTVFNRAPVDGPRDFRCDM